MESFYKPEVLKNDSSLSKELENLKKYPITNDKKIYMLEKGIEGEKEVEYHLTKSNIGMYIMRDINLLIDGLKAQVDFVVITSHHCYFIECKNYTADIIHIDENRNFEISTKCKNRYRKMGIKSPLSQANDQLSVFKRLYLKDSDNNKNIFNGLKFEDYFKTMVVFTNPESRIDNKRAPFDTKYRVLKVDNLINQIEYDEKHCKGTKLSQNQMLEIANYFLDNNVEIKIDESPQIIEYRTYYKNIDYNKNTNYNIKRGKSELRVGSIVIIVLILCGIFSISQNYDSRNNNYNQNSTNSVQTKPTKNTNTINTQQSTTNNNTNTVNDEQRILSDNNISAINNLKKAYNNSKEFGFDLYDYNYCIYLKEILPGSFVCSGKPMKVNFTNDNTLSIYKNYNCYYLEYDLNTKKVINSSYEYVGYDNKCASIDVGLIHYNSTNPYLIKIGGYNKILEMARLAHNETIGFENYFNYNHIAERGGNASLSMTYHSVVDKYFRTMVNKGSNENNSLEDFNRMVEYYYYIMNDE